VKIWYISRTYLPEQTGGALVRIAQVDYLRSRGAECIVVAPAYDAKQLQVSADEVRVPYALSRIRYCQLLERTGVLEDYLDPWVGATLELLRSRVAPSDLVFATSGGELGSIKLGSRLKELTGCRLVVTLHDPVDYTRVSGKKINNIPHVDRERQERRYLANADLVITSSKSNQASLTEKYPEMAARIRCSYFGFITKAELSEKAPSTGLTIVYGGTYDKNQSPELLAQVVYGLDNIEAHFVGNHAAYKPLDLARASQQNCKFVNQLSYPDFLRYLTDHADMGFVSLASPYLGACVPSKMFEYINIGLPIFGALPAGDAVEIINHHGYGVACEFNDIWALRKAILKIAGDKHLLKTYRQQILNDRDDWFMPGRMREVYEWLRDL